MGQKPGDAVRRCSLIEPFPIEIGNPLLCAAIFDTEVHMTDATVGLTEAIGALRQELLDAMGEGKDAAMRFRLAPVELSMQVAVTKEAGGKIGWHVLGLGGSYSSATTQTLKLRLEPVWKLDDGSYTSDFTIADTSPKLPRIGPRPNAGP